MFETHTSHVLSDCCLFLSHSVKARSWLVFGVLSLSGTTSRCEGPGKVGCLASAGVQGPHGSQGKHLFPLVAGSYQQKCRHTRRTGGRGHSPQSLRKHACFCLSCKRTVGFLTGPAFAVHKAHRVNLLVRHRCSAFQDGQNRNEHLNVSKVFAELEV